MRRDDVVKRIKEKLDEIGVSKHLASVEKVSAQVQVSVLIGGQARRINMRSGITREELEMKLHELAGAWSLRPSPDQIDLEEAIAEAR